MKWCTLNWDKKGLFVYWSYMYGSIYDENYDNGEEYHLDIPFDWWAKSWEEAKEDFESVYHPIVLPWFMAYLFLGVQTIIHIIKRKKWYKQVKKEENMTDIEVLEYTDSRITELEKENAELKAENKQIIKRERVVPEHYLCEMIEKCKELKAQIEEQKAHCKAVDEVNEKMKCCGNCINHNDLCYCELDRKEVNASNVCDKWEWEKE